MKVKVWGSRGSMPVSGPDSKLYGGNTTCIEVKSECLPPGERLVVDAGSGFYPMSLEQARDFACSCKGGQTTKAVTNILFTHWHPDHTMGLPMSPLLYNPRALIRMYGPVDHGVGPQQMLEHNMIPPFFPVHYKTVKAELRFVPLEFPASVVLAFHPKGGSTKLGLSDFLRLEAEVLPLNFGKRGRFPIGECLIVKMYKSNHPEQTVSYRFEERPTGRIFVLLTDHENTDGLPLDLRRHIAGAHLLIMDAQYDEERYKRFTAGFGHGTGPYCAWVALECGVVVLAITHHDPAATDNEIMSILEEACARMTGFPPVEGKQLLPRIIVCADYQQIDV